MCDVEALAPAASEWTTVLPGDEIGLSSDDDAGNGHGEVGDDDDEVGDEGEDEGERDGVRKERKEVEEEEWWKWRGGAKRACLR